MSDVNHREHIAVDTHNDLDSAILFKSKDDGRRNKPSHAEHKRKHALKNVVKSDAIVECTKFLNEAFIFEILLRL